LPYGLFFPNRFSKNWAFQLYEERVQNFIQDTLGG
jgi:hypothetical protein